MWIRKALLIVGMLLISSISRSEWMADGKQLHDEQFAGKHGFNVLLGITDKPTEFNKQWEIPQKAVPVSLAKTINRNEDAAIFVLFTGCPEDQQGLCNVEADIRLLKPDATVYGELKKTDFWKANPSPKSPQLERAHTGIGFSIETNDPSGEYRAEVDIRDLVSNITFHLERRFTVK